MMSGFLFWLFFVGILVSGLQDLRRREVDNWLNLFLLVSGFVFVFYKAIFERDVSIVFQAGFALVIMFSVMNVFYYGKVFAGGDAKLLVAMTVFFIGVNFNVTLINMGIFLFFLMFSGSVYGLVYSFVLYYKNKEKVNKEIRKGFDNLWVRYAIIRGCFV
ncbi:MAG: prepilin peptidase, partial [Nanoarchaeota archaeon]|nr:prepilin peptidase [Nanoarchaeota archaeon]